MPRVVLKENQEGPNDINNERRLADLEGFKEEREVARGTSEGWLRHMHKQYTQGPSLRGNWC